MRSPATRVRLPPTRPALAADMIAFSYVLIRSGQLEKKPLPGQQGVSMGGAAQSPVVQGTLVQGV